MKQKLRQLGGRASRPFAASAKAAGFALGARSGRQFRVFAGIPCVFRPARVVLGRLQTLQWLAPRPKRSTEIDIGATIIDILSVK
jgi:hypothetical protein